MIKAQILENHKIMISNNAISDSVKYETVKFSFPSFWEKYQKTAVFKNAETVISVVLQEGNPLCISENECYIPHEVLTFPGFSISVFGNEGETLATTANGFVTVIKSGYEKGVAPKDPTPDEYAQIIGLMNETKDVAQSVRDDADNGLFDGEKGDKGDKGVQGEKGDTGPQGPQGAKGDTGAQGPQGVKGDKGDKGEKGDKGDKGDKGVAGVYIGSGDMPEDCNVQIDPNGEALDFDQTSYANAIKNTKSGEIVTMNDVSPIEHSLGVKLTSETITDFSKVNVTASGLNLFKPFDAEATQNGVTAKLTEDGFVETSGEYSVANTLLYIYPPQEYERIIYPAGQYFRYLANYNGVNYYSDIDINFQCVYLNGGSFNMQSGIVTTATSPFYIKDILVQIRKETGMGVKMPLIFGSKGLNITEFEPYKEFRTATANADGTVTGLKSISPNMVITTDTQGAIINADYNVDTKTYIDRKFAELSQAMLNL